MHELLKFSHFETDPAESQLEPDDETQATYVVTNVSDNVVLTNIELTHLNRVDNDGHASLRCTPSVVHLASSLGPHEQRYITVSLKTVGHLPGRHGLRVRARFGCEPTHAVTESIFEFDVASD